MVEKRGIFTINMLQMPANISVWTTRQDSIEQSSGASPCEVQSLTRGHLNEIRHAKM